MGKSKKDLRTERDEMRACAARLAEQSRAAHNRMNAMVQELAKTRAERDAYAAALRHALERRR